MMSDRSRRAGLAVAVVVASLACRPARAQDDGTRTHAGPAFVEVDHGPWEFGIDFGMIVPTQKKSFSRLVDNQRAYDLLAAESVGDEVAEGFVAPPLPGYSRVAGTFKQMPDVGAHLYYRTSPWLSFGLDGGYGLKRNMRLDDRGIYQSNNFLSIAYSGNIIHLAAPVKVGAAYGAFRPYLTAGPGLYWLQELARISFNDADDPQVKPLEVIHKNRLCAGANAGVGVEWRWERSLIGLDVAYHKVFSGQDHADFVEPKLRLSVLF